jgi:hypothetical protein
MMPDSVARMVLTVSDSLELSIVAKATIVVRGHPCAMSCWPRRSACS